VVGLRRNHAGRMLLRSATGVEHLKREAEQAEELAK
jgi:hypothetical protein